MAPQSPTFISELVTSFIGAIVRGELQGVAKDASEEAMQLAVRNLRRRFPRPMLILAREVLNVAIGDGPISTRSPAGGNEREVIDVECEVVEK